MLTTTANYASSISKGLRPIKTSLALLTISYCSHAFCQEATAANALAANTEQCQEQNYRISLSGQAHNKRKGSYATEANSKVDSSFVSAFAQPFSFKLIVDDGKQPDLSAFKQLQNQDGEARLALIALNDEQQHRQTSEHAFLLSGKLVACEGEQYQLHLKINEKRQTGENEFSFTRSLKEGIWAALVANEDTASQTKRSYSTKHKTKRQPIYQNVFIHIEKAPF